jgi:hypothetical protein
MLTDQTRWSLGRGNPLVPSRWQATSCRRSCWCCLSRPPGDGDPVGVIVGDGIGDRKCCRWFAIIFVPTK